jgi:hypothetical protein
MYPSNGPTRPLTINSPSETLEETYNDDVRISPEAFLSTSENMPPFSKKLTKTMTKEHKPKKWSPFGFTSTRFLKF